MTDAYIRSARDAKPFIGQAVYWDDTSARYTFLRSGILEGTYGRHVIIRGEYHSISSLKNLRNFENGGDWAKA